MTATLAALTAPSKLDAITCDRLDRAWAAGEIAKRDAGRSGPGYACGRIYVAFAGLDRAARQRLKNWAAFRGRTFTGRDGHVSDAIYVGYDNATGHETAQGEAIVAHLTGWGVRCYVEGMED